METIIRDQTCRHANVPLFIFLTDTTLVYSLRKHVPAYFLCVPNDVSVNVMWADKEAGY